VYIYIDKDVNSRKITNYINYGAKEMT
jgi:hypothetical protein